MPRWQGIIFDLDGTLADTPQAITTIVRKVLADRGVTASEPVIRATVGKPLAKSLGEFLRLPAEHKEVASAAAEYQRLFRAHLMAEQATLAYPGAFDGVRKLRADGRLLGVATSKPRGAARKIIELMGMAEEFAVVAGDDTVTRSKPDPEMALYVADELHLAPRDCVVVGDGVSDIEMAEAAGMAAIGVSYGVASADQLHDAGAARVVDSFDDLVSLLLAAEEES